MSILHWFKKKIAELQVEPTPSPQTQTGASQPGQTPQPAPFGLEEDELLEFEMAALAPRRPLLNALQHTALPEATFRNHPELLRDLTGPTGRPPLSHFLTHAALVCGHVPEPETPADAWLQQPLEIHPYLREGYSVHVIVMPPPEQAPECFFSAIVYKDSEPKAFLVPSSSTRYFTLERTASNAALLCEWSASLKHLNYGQFLPPDRDAFAEAVFGKILNS
jgi:hypothetical protein